jgi:hypothetical protein
MRRMTRHDWNKSAYNPKSRYPMFHIRPDTSTPGRRLGCFLVMLVLSLMFIWRWTVVGNKLDAERAAVQAEQAQRVADYKHKHPGVNRVRPDN